MRLLFTFIFLLLFQVSTAFGQTDSIKNYLISALDIMKNKSVNKSVVNWDSLYAVSLKSASKAKTLSDTYPIINAALSELKDSHSKFYPPKLVKAYTLGYKATGQTFPIIKAEMKEGKYAYISLPDIGSFNNDDWNQYINDFYQKVNLLQKQDPKGWILDLRDNFGGMLYPMYAAVAAFINQKNAVGTKDSKGKIEYLNYRPGKFYEGQKATQFFHIKEKTPKRIKTPIAILISKKTGSSGEFITAAFVGQYNVSLIGENTQGLTSANQEYQLSDGAFIALTIGNIVDRNGKEYSKIGEGIAPNSKIDNLSKGKNDEAYLKKAADFLNKSEKH